MQIPTGKHRHTSGRIYEVLFCTNRDTTDPVKYPVTVVYQGENGKLWSRPLSDWDRSFVRVQDGIQ